MDYNILDAIVDNNLTKVEEQINKNPKCVNYICCKDIPYKNSYPDYSYKYNNTTMLTIATEKNYADIVKLLLNRGADPNKISLIHNLYSRQPPLVVACVQNNHDALKILLKSDKININPLNRVNNSPLNSLTATSSLFNINMEERKKTIKLLLSHNDCNIDTQNIRGCTPLINVAYKICDCIHTKPSERRKKFMSFYIDLIKMLIKKRCNIYLKDNDGNTFIDIIYNNKKYFIQRRVYHNIDKIVNGIVASCGTLFDSCTIFIKYNTNLIDMNALSKLNRDIRKYFDFL